MASTSRTVDSKQSSSTISKLPPPNLKIPNLSVNIPPPQYDVHQSTVSEQRQAPAPPPPQRTISDPLPPSPSRPYSNLARQSTYDAATPKSAGYKSPRSPKNVKFGAGSDDRSMTSPTSYKGMPKRRHSHESKVNVYTECGRHSNDWLFGGFSVAGVVKKFWEKKE